jgi:hypothetical protein
MYSSQTFQTLYPHHPDRDGRIKPEVRVFFQTEKISGEEFASSGRSDPVDADIKSRGERQRSRSSTELR